MAERPARWREWPTVLALSVLVLVVDAVCVFVSMLSIYLFAVRDSSTYLPPRPLWMYWAVDVLSLVLPPVVTLGPLALLMTPRRRKQVLVGGLLIYALMQLAVTLAWRR